MQSLIGALRLWLWVKLRLVKTKWHFAWYRQVWCKRGRYIFFSILRDLPISCKTCLTVELVYFKVWNCIKKISHRKHPTPDLTKGCFSLSLLWCTSVSQHWVLFFFACWIPHVQSVATPCWARRKVKLWNPSQTMTWVCPH